jgi:hypothetical protein
MMVGNVAVNMAMTAILALHSNGIKKANGDVLEAGRHCRPA